MRGVLRFAVALGFFWLAAPVRAQHGPDWPDWAYGLLEPLSAQSRIAKPCPAGSLPFDCAFVEEPVPEDGVKRSLPGSDKSFTRNETYSDYNPADWYPGDHPPMPDIVAHGHQNLKLRACALCHYPNGQGRTENGQIAGLSEQYILQQLQAFVDGTRRSADLRKANTNEMAMIAARLTEQEKKQAAAYYAAIPFRKMSRAVETAQVPQLRTTLNALMLPIPNLPQMPLGDRIVQVPENPERVLLTRNPREQWIAYVPVGSLEAGKKLATTSVKTLQCNLCHGPLLEGLGDIPGIAGRTAPYLMRQLWDFKQGTRKNVLMEGVVKNLTAQEMLQITAYITSLDPPAAAKQ